MPVHLYTSCGPFSLLSSYFFVLNIICCNSYLFLSYLFGVLSVSLLCLYVCFFLNLGKNFSIVLLKVWSMLLISPSMPVSQRHIFFYHLPKLLLIFFVSFMFVSKLSFSYNDISVLWFQALIFCLLFDPLFR